MVDIGDVIEGKYRIDRLLGSGGMGEVYEGEHLRIHRRVAIKVLNAGLNAEPEFVRRFEREAQAAGRIGSRHIVEVLDLGELSNGDRYMVMEYLEGETLAERTMRKGPMPAEDIFLIAIQLLDGLTAAHEAGIVHRDLKPANVFLLDDGQRPDFVKILDFGVSKFLGLGKEDSTTTGLLLGTPRYMAPEQARGSKDIDHRVDIYAVGLILYRALTGRSPFVADSYNELMFKLVLEETPSIRAVLPNADGDVVSIVAKAMDRDREKRFNSAAEMAMVLRDWLEKRGVDVPPPPSRRQSLPSVGLGFDPTLVSVQPQTSVTKMSSVAEAPPRERSRAAWWMLGALAIGAVAGSIELALRTDDPVEPAPAVEPTSEPKPEPVKSEAPPPATSMSEPPAPVASTAPSASAPAPIFKTPRTLPKPRPQGNTRKYRRDL
jgi:eukaryotic-like serine/threonine-protein kinase